MKTTFRHGFRVWPLICSEMHPYVARRHGYSNTSYVPLSTPTRIIPIWEKQQDLYVYDSFHTHTMCKGRQLIFSKVPFIFIQSNLSQISKGCVEQDLWMFALVNSVLFYRYSINLHVSVCELFAYWAHYSKTFRLLSHFSNLRDIEIGVVCERELSPIKKGLNSQNSQISATTGAGKKKPVNCRAIVEFFLFIVSSGALYAFYWRSTWTTFQTGLMTLLNTRVEMEGTSKVLIFVKGSATWRVNNAS